VKRRVQRSVDNAEDVAGPLADETRDTVSVHRPPAQRVKYQDIQRPLEKLELVVRLSRHVAYYTINI
jgi:hypothetical protein